MLYSDINSKNIENNDYDVNAIENSIKNILLIRKFELPALNNFGSNLYQLLFEQPSLQVKEMIKFEVRSLLNFYEPRIQVKNIDVEFENNNIFVQLSFILVDDFSVDLKTIKLRLR